MTFEPSMKAGHMPSARYVLPTYEERTAYGFKRQDPYAKLFEDRIIFLGVQVDDASADDVMAQLLVLESQDPDRDITLYINSPGGSFTALTAIYDTMQYIKPDVTTVCLGQAASAAAVLLAAGAPGKRLALPNARILIHQPAMGGQGGASGSRTPSRTTRDVTARRSTATSSATRFSPPRARLNTASSTRCSSAAASRHSSASKRCLPVNGPGRCATATHSRWCASPFPCIPAASVARA